MKTKPTLKELEEASKVVLGTKQPAKSKYKNRKPSKKEFNQKWRLEKKSK